jgi:hypothetical protein
MAIAPLIDLLPLVFDAVVLRFTRRVLLPIERNAILTALVNSVGESVIRRVGNDGEAREPEAAAATKPKDITQIETFDRFSDEWVSRLEIIESIEFSSGLDRSLSELALFLMECRLDTLLAVGDSGIVGIGQISPLRSVNETRPASLEIFNRLDKAASLSETLGSQGIWRRLFGMTQAKRSALRLMEEAQRISMQREPLPCTIVLAKTLAFKRDECVPKKIKIQVPEKNRVIDPKVPPLSHNPGIAITQQKAPQFRAETRVPK